jgi:hypothetical protein
MRPSNTLYAHAVIKKTSTYTPWFHRIGVAQQCALVCLASTNLSAGSSNCRPSLVPIVIGTSLRKVRLGEAGKARRGRAVLPEGAKTEDKRTMHRHPVP